MSRQVTNRGLFAALCLALLLPTGAWAHGSPPDHFGSNGERTAGGWHWLCGTKQVAEVRWDTLQTEGDQVIDITLRSEELCWKLGDGV